jgi:hypothetical protein
MILKNFRDKFDTLLMPIQDEIGKAQREMTQRIQYTLKKAEKDVASNLNRMTDEQRVKAVEKEWENTEAHLLSALGSLYKSMLYLYPTINRLLDYPAPTDRKEKEVKGTLVD